ncbi:alpha-amylase family glycosyl hydrolase [Stigmatella sp. ncwal1]|uniref:Alpha-amylase family glycosyl hydrolase n=1 Tax=Stigmatella ashevillensis TaxID=2995309 RepID=A0ABT5DBS1_9BACT|nr:alpha-amylase family glycosyl hydrolase [Stigmatella ashevillena]MDC0710499.1 alpha-amylase family glycosyl hydrolase [Stigmatella ashevillena]
MQSPFPRNANLPLASPLGVVTFALLPALFWAGCAHAPPAVPAAPAPEAAPAPAAPAPAPRAWADEVLYFVVVDRFADGDPAHNVPGDVSAPGTFHGGDLKGLTQQLDELTSLGITALWITPVVKNIDGFVTGSGFPDWGYHGYWADDFHAMDPRFGTEEELRTLVKEAHARGIRVLLDVVYNHTGYGSRYLKLPETKHWLRSEETGTCGQDNNITSCVAGLPDFKTEQPEVAQYLIDAQIAWAKRSGVDGFRLDTLKHLEHGFWQEHRRRTREELGPDFFLLGELWGGELASLDKYFAGDEVDAGFDFSFQGSTLAFLQGRGRTVAFDRYLQSRGKIRPGYHLSHFLSSHDVPGALFQLGGDKARFQLAAVLQLTTAGIPTIYYGEEVARPGGDWPANRDDMPWGARDVKPGAGKPRDEALRKTYQKLISIRRAHPALSRGTHRGLSTDGDLYVFLRHDAQSGDAVMVAINRGQTPVSVSLPWPEAWGTPVAEDLLNGGRLEGPTLELAVEPLSARILGKPG